MPMRRRSGSGISFPSSRSSNRGIINTSAVTWAALRVEAETVNDVAKKYSVLCPLDQRRLLPLLVKKPGRFPRHGYETIAHLDCASLTFYVCHHYPRILAHSSGTLCRHTYAQKICDSIGRGPTQST